MALSSNYGLAVLMEYEYLLTAVALSKLEPDWWLELGNTYLERIQQRIKLVETHKSDVFAMLPGSELACKELMEISIQFVCARYPNYFELDEKQLTLYNNILNTSNRLEVN
jgi:Protein of unknown function (DUF3445)